MALEQEISDYEILTRRTRPSAMDLDSPEQLTDFEILSEENLPESTVHSDLIRYLVSVFEWLFRVEGWFISADLAIVYAHRRYLSPDVAVFKGLALSEQERLGLTSYRLGSPDRPAPCVVFEVSSEATWEQDLRSKPEQYGRLGVKEYFAYDPNTPRLWPDNTPRLKGWCYISGQPEELNPDSQGRLWSEELVSWLVPDGAYLRCYDADFHRRLTELEAERAALSALLEKLRQANIDPDKL